MANVEFRNEQDGQSYLPRGERATSLTADVRDWAERNEFEQVVFWQEGEKLWVQLDEQRLNYWIPVHVLESGKREDIEMQLDYARGAHRRSAAGYQKFDK